MHNINATDQSSGTDISSGTDMPCVRPKPMFIRIRLPQTNLTFDTTHIDLSD